ncbi:redoxin domain-containing protein [Halovenus sp. WSH3]|uniref:Redoxin domain-containing protein n=1 Tax=Halovenus carboxidivorans TaxID=2692199 RepID=A0A6B0T8U4_9EURY|nr:redoxin domain-containing protein [Halovenus carboxidivorans]MXR51762.1 redoxin domain-containing protein [Halovenus carboxidivorans]
MITAGETAPEFTAPLAYGDDEVGTFALSERLSDGPLVLAFFPGAFTPTCSHEMDAFQTRLSEFEDAGATIYGVSVDSPFALSAFRDQLGLDYALVSDANREIIDAFGVSMDWEEYGLREFSKRAVFVVGSDGEVTYSWVRDDTTTEPDYDEVLDAADAAT